MASPDWVGRELPVGDISAKGIHDEFLSLGHVRDRCRLRTAPVRNTGPMESKQEPPRLSIDGMKLTVALAKEREVPGHHHSRFRRLANSYLPYHLAGRGIGGAEDSVVGDSWNDFIKRRAQE